MKSTRSARASGRAGRCSETSTAHGSCSTQIEERLGGLRIELRRRLVEQQQPRTEGERRSEADALQLAGRELGDRPLGQVAGTDRGQRLLDARPDLARRRRRRSRGRTRPRSRRGSSPPGPRGPGRRRRRGRRATPGRPRACRGRRPSRARRRRRRGSAGRAPRARAVSVDLPPPEGPSRTTCSPSSIVSETPSSTGAAGDVARSAGPSTCARASHAPTTTSTERAGERQPVEPASSGGRGARVRPGRP